MKHQESIVWSKRKIRSWALAGIVSFLLGLALIIWSICGMWALSGRGDPMTEGVLIGLDTSTATQGASDMAQESKTALMAKILLLQQKLEAAATSEQ